MLSLLYKCICQIVIACSLIQTGETHFSAVPNCQILVVDSLGSFKAPFGGQSREHTATI